MSQPKTEEAIFCDALDIPIAKREDFVKRACQNDPQLLKSVNALLRLHDTDEDFLDTPALDVSSNRVYEQPGDQIGCYHLESLIGEGGFGVVWKAQQLAPIQRNVAVKIVKLGMDSEGIVQRFEDERQTLALMNHPNIATVLDAGVADGGRSYFVMELVEGTTIDQFFTDHKLNTTQRLEVFGKVCRAVHHAHQKGIVHRDLKPSNILVSHSEGENIPKVIDFGIATAIQVEDPQTDGPERSKRQLAIGTPQYMSPEQWRGDCEIDTRSDIYSLGVVLYRVLAGSAPELNHQAGDQSFLPPSRRLELSDKGENSQKLVTTIDNDLDCIVRHAMQPNPDQRYQSASEFAIDIERYLSGKPVLAHPGGAIYQFKKFANRHRLAFGSALIAIAALVAGIVASTWGLLHANQQREIAESQKLIAVEEQQEAERLRKIAESENRKLRIIAKVLKNILPEADPYRGMNRGFQIRQNLDQLIESLDALSSEPELEAELRTSVAHIYRNLSRYVWARQQFQSAYKIRRESLGETHHKTLDCLAGLASCEVNLGNLENAERIVNNLLDVTDEKTAKIKRIFLSALRTKRKIRIRQNRYEEAFKIAKQNVEYSKVIFAKEGYRRMDVLGEFADSAQRIGNLDEAETTLREALQIMERNYPKRKYVTANTKFRLAQLLIKKGDFEEARELTISFVDMQSVTLGESDEFVIRGMATLSEIDRLDQRLENSEKVARKAIALSNQAPKSQIGSRATAHRQLAKVLSDKAPVDAIESWKSAIEFRRQRLGDHVLVADDLSELTEVYIRLEKYERAAEVSSQVIRILEKKKNATSKLISAYMQHSQIFKAMGMEDEAAEFELSARQLLDKD